MREMADIPAREFRNNLSGVLRRVEAGERLRVTVSGRPVAAIGPAAVAAKDGFMGNLYRR
jgi:prevent-host-death family protein